jgi:hypothetical protein
MTFAVSARAASTSALCPAGFTFKNTFATFPCGSMMKVLRAESFIPLYSINRRSALKTLHKKSRLTASKNDSAKRAELVRV